MAEHPDQNIALERDVEFQEKVVSMARIAKVVKGGRRIFLQCPDRCGRF